MLRLGRRAALVGAVALHGCSPPPSAWGAADDAWQSTPAKDGQATPAAPASGRLRLPPMPQPPWERAGQLDGLRAAGVRGPSEHLDGRHERVVRVNELGASYDRPRAGLMPVGALVVELHYRPGSNEPDAIFAMEKRPPGFAPEQGDWEFVVLDGSLRVQARGKLALCARCHRTAPHDLLFGPGTQDVAQPGPAGQR
jgi:hypothetical protein